MLLNGRPRNDLIGQLISDLKVYIHIHPMKFERLLGRTTNPGDENVVMEFIHLLSFTLKFLLLVFSRSRYLAFQQIIAETRNNCKLAVINYILTLDTILRNSNIVRIKVLTIFS